MEENNLKNIANIMKGVLISLIFTMVFLFIFSIILTYTSLNEKLINPFIIVITAISIFIGSTIGNNSIKKNGIINGGLIGGIYLILLYVISSIINRKIGFTIQSLIMIVSGMFCGMFGGILSVNKK